MNYKEIANKFYLLFSLFLILFIIYFSLTLFVTTERFTVTVLPLAVIIAILGAARKYELNYLQFFEVVMICALLLFSMFYFFKEFNEIISIRVGTYNALDYLLVIVLMLLIVWLIFKNFGSFFGIIIISPLILVFIGPYLAYPFHTPRISFKFLIAALSLDLGGIWGSLTQVMATVVAACLVYAAFIRGFGGLKQIVGFFMKLLGKNKILFPQVAVLSSMIFGTFSGSALANVAGTGAFTIPMMKSKKILPECSGAIEAVASTGGILMPPIMGAATFVMAEFLGISYLKVIYAGIVPAVIFFAIIAISIYLSTPNMINSYERKESKKTKVEKEQKNKQGPNLLPFILISLIMLMYTLMVMRAPVLKASMYALGTFLFLNLIYIFLPIRKSSAELSGSFDIKSKIEGFIKNIIKSIEETGESVALMVVLGAGLGITASTLFRLGILWRLGNSILDLSQGNIMLLLILTILICIPLGMAVSALATYLLVVPIVIIAFKSLGVDDLVTHFIVFYASSLAPITPPIAPAVSVASQLAKSDFIKTSKWCLLIGMPLFLMPLAFLKYPGLLSFNFPSILAVFTSMLSISLGFFATLSKRKIFKLLFIGIGVIILIVQVKFYVCLFILVIDILVCGFSVNYLYKEKDFFSNE